ncbi:MAG: endonuclease V [Bacteroidota bacterium]
MIVAIDVHYRTNFAKAVSIEFQTWQDKQPTTIHEVLIEEVAEYVPGEFYKRELPCILKVLEKTPLEEIELIIVDGYVVLSDEGKYGLGRYLYEVLKRKIPIVGVAKRSFKDNEKQVRRVLRGASKNPLYVTSIGVEVDAAAKQVQKMAGAYRIPDLLKILDQHTKARSSIFY